MSDFAENSCPSTRQGKNSLLEEMCLEGLSELDKLDNYMATSLGAQIKDFKENHDNRNHKLTVKCWQNFTKGSK